MTNLPEDMQGIQHTPVTEQGVRAFFTGLVAIHETMTYSAPAQVALAITPALASLLERFCSDDPRYSAVMAEVWVNDYQAIKAAGRHATKKSWKALLSARWFR